MRRNGVVKKTCYTDSNSDEILPEKNIFKT